MDISDFIANYKQCATEFLSSYCIVNGAIMNLEEIHTMGYKEFSLRSKINMPLKLYRYYPNKEIIKDKQTINYSLQALCNNTVFLQSPTEFDDVYDSDINIDYFEYERLRLIEYCKRCGIEVDIKQSTSTIGNTLIKTLYNYYIKNNNLNNVFVKKPDTKIEQLANQIFTNKVIIELCNTNDFGIAVSKTINQEYSDYISELKNTFRTVCFATTPYSQLMWGGAYADSHKGFCLEYTILPNESIYQELYYNLFPMIYCKVRPNMTLRIVSAKDKEMTEETMWDIYYNGALRKSIDWAFQNEWRLLRPLKSNIITDYNIKFYPITKVYLGNRMSANKRKEIIDICNEKNIPYVGIERNPDLFEMQDCPVKCENCIKHQNAIKNML